MIQGVHRAVKISFKDLGRIDTIGKQLFLCYIIINSTLGLVFMKEKLSMLCSVLSKDQPVLIQTHDFPDHDALGAAYALLKLLESYGYKMEIAYGGHIQSLLLIEFVEYLGCPLLKLDEIDDLCRKILW